jgi:hypothetical protein
LLLGSLDASVRISCGWSTCSYSDDDLRGWAGRLRSIEVPTCVYFRHEEEPTAPGYALRLAEKLRE